MQEPFILYVDEISPDEIKATVSDVNSYWFNLRGVKYSLEDAMPVSVWSGSVMAFMGERINGINIIPMGRFVCMLVGGTGNRSMVLLDLIDKEELAERIAEKLTPSELRERFMEVYHDILNHPENHGKYKWVVGQSKKGLI